MPVVLIRDENLTYEIDGDVIAGPESTRFDARDISRARWMEATLYRKSDGSGYVLHTVNYSVVWHLDGTDHVRKIRKPDPVLIRELPAGAVYCGDLPSRPGRDQCPRLTRWPDPGAVVVAELPQHKLVRAPDAEKMIGEMTLVSRSGGVVSAAMSEPMRNLQVEAEENDAAFAAARPVIRM